MDIIKNFFRFKKTILENVKPSSFITKAIIEEKPPNSILNETTVCETIPAPALDLFTLKTEELVKIIFFVAHAKFKEVMPEIEVLIIVQTAIVNKQDIGDIYAAIANLLFNAGQAELAVEYFLKSLTLKPNIIVHSSFLQALLMTEASNEEILNECLTYVDKYYKKNLSHSQSYKNLFTHKIRDKKLKIGYACHFFHNSVGRSIVLPFIKAHDRNKVEIFCYYDWNKNDETPDMLCIADHWRNTQGKDDDDFFNLVRNDDIDVFVEMNGHTAINRYAACMRRVAPIQISFYNWAATSGIPNMDYNIVDSLVLDPSEDKYFTEKIYRLPNAYGVANFSDNFPEVSPSPHLKNGYVTFGSFGSSHKVNEDVVKLWCEVLKAVPNSKFFMKAAALTANFYQTNFYQYFANNGINKDRLIFEGWSEHNEMLKRYADVDIALDTFPYTGSTTTLEATWQGIPVITYSGNRLSTKSGLSILTNLGLTEHIAHTKEEVVKIAISLANDSKRLVELRSTLRDKFKNSILYDARLFARDLEDAYYFMWNEWWEQTHSVNENLALSTEQM